MDSAEAKRRREAWGNKPCAHTNVEKERILGADTGDKVCSECGNVVVYMGDDAKRPKKE